MPCRPMGKLVTDHPATSRSRVIGGGVMLSNARAPTDPFFYSTVTLQNIVAGSRYRISVAATGETLATGSVAEGEVPDAHVTHSVTNVAAYSNPQLLQVDVRYASGTTKYLPLIQYGVQFSSGASLYLSQVVDGVAQ